MQSMHGKVMHIDQWMKARNLSNEEMARKIRTKTLTCDPSQVSRYRRGLIRPGWGIIARIKVVTAGAVSADDFMEAAQ